MTNEQIAAKLKKTAASLSAHVARGNTTNGQRSLDLIDRYEELRDLCNGMRGTVEKMKVWDDHCAAHGFDSRHTGYDFFA